VLEPSGVTGSQLRLLINRPNRYVSNADVQRISETAQPWESVKQLAREKRGLGVDSLPGLVSRVRSLNQEAHREGGPTPAALVTRIVDEFELERFWSDRRSRTNGQQDDARPARVLDSIRLLARDSTSATQLTRAWDKLEQKEQGDQDTAKDDLSREEDEKRDQVVIGTIHSSKGREYRSVVLPDYDADLTRCRPEQVEEERRVLYVGVTRARDAVLLTIDRAKEEVHQFIRELALAPESGELPRLAKSLEQLRGEEQNLAGEAAKVAAEIGAIESGASAKACRQRLEEIGLGEELTRSMGEIEGELAAGGLSKFGRQVSGKQSRLEHELAQLRAQRDRAEEISNELRILESRPETYLVPLREKAADLQRLLAENRLNQVRNRDRRAEIELLFPSTLKKREKRH